jgi:predicted TIM-barrel fold metal-dependent hydrolase
MIVDAHCHIWQRWPYRQPVAAPDTHASAENLLRAMDASGVDHAVFICAAIGDNTGNVDYAFEAAALHPSRFSVFPDIECFWQPQFRTPGAPARFELALARWSFRGFAHYMAEAETGDWLTGEEGLAFFSIAARRGLIVSLFAMPHQMPAVCRLADTFPEMPILLHHYGYAGPRSAGTAGALELVCAAAQCPNVFVKFSGMGNIAGPADAFPFERLQAIPHALAEAFGPARIVWGSDWPVSGRWMGYAEALSLVRDGGAIASADWPAVAGGTMARLLGL